MERDVESGGLIGRGTDNEVGEISGNKKPIEMHQLYHPVDGQAGGTKLGGARCLLP